MDMLSNKAFDEARVCFYKSHLKSLSDYALREETIAAVTEANAIRMEACRQQWETLGRASEFLECYNKAVDNMTHT